MQHPWVRPVRLPAAAVKQLIQRIWLAGDIAVDQRVYAELGASGYFEAMDMAVDEVATLVSVEGQEKQK